MVIPDPDAFFHQRIQPVADELFGQSDRACALVAAAWLETQLEELLRGKMLASVDKGLFKGQGPLSTFAAKINLCAAFGLISAARQRDLHVIRDIRNRFAHSFQTISFEDEPIRGWSFGLIFGPKLLGHRDVDARRNFEAAAAFHLGAFGAELEVVTRVEEPGDALDELRARMKTFPDNWLTMPGPRVPPAS